MNIQPYTHNLNYCIRCSLNQGTTKVVFTEQLQKHIEQHDKKGGDT